jgi:hypothetical protein
MKTRIEKIGPEQARIYLEGNVINRPLSRFQVQKYATVMQQGRWRLNGEPIIIASDGTLLDGQHRLYAIIQAGVHVDCLVVADVPREVFSTLGTGSKRSASDLAAMLGCKNATWVASTLSCLYRFEMGLIEYAASAPNDKISELLSRYPEAPSVTAETGASPIKQFFSIGIFSGFYIWLSRRYPVEAGEFFGQLKTGVGLVAGSPVLLFRERMMGVKRGKVRLQHREVVALLIKAWNAHLSGKWPKILKHTASGPAAEEFPVLQDGSPIVNAPGVSVRKRAA